MAAADASGTLALLQEFFETRMRVTNSPALYKALLINGARSVNTLYDFEVQNTVNFQGWGLIQLQCDFRKHPMVECRIAVNSAIRAANWSDTYPDFQSPESWDWKVVERKTGRLVRLLRQMGKASRTIRCT